ncbi:MAG TPA: asparagine synthetase B, partial [Ignavibacteriales bacterium]|nr:asparagine synthetase B [Ignavibacteriales bacterium]
FNGEIYNFQELKKDLIKKGHIFSSDTDTEVVVHLYQEYSCNLLDMLDGMFAFALYDTIKKRLFLAKDPFGKKPLFYAWQNQQLIFSSEIKAIVKYPNFRAEIQQLSLQKYLAFDYIPTPHSIYKSVLKLTAGSYIFIDINKPITQNSITPVKYFNIIFTPKLSISEPEAQEQLKILLV